MRSLSLMLLAAVLQAGSPYTASIESWRAERENVLKSPTGWLTVAGLFWLQEGENRAGGDAGLEVALPARRAPRRVGVFVFRHGRVSFKAAAGAAVTLNAKPVITADLKPNTDLLQVGDFTMFVIQRGERFGIRLRDLHSEGREKFGGLHWYPVKDSYRVVAKFTAYDQPQKIAITNVLGQTEGETSPGFATFDLMGHSYRLDPVLEGDRLFFIFRDLTAGKTTYGAGRFLYTELPKEGKVVLDFNKAENPPCAFTAFATCPLPPKQNRLPIRIEAGELNYGDH